MINNRIKELREDTDKTQKDIAIYLNISRSAYSNYENGINKIPLEMWVKLAKYYNTSIDYLCELTDLKTAYPKK